jgi:hypothetical protein
VPFVVGCDGVFLAQGRNFTEILSVLFFVFLNHVHSLLEFSELCSSRAACGLVGAVPASEQPGVSAFI